MADASSSSSVDSTAPPTMPSSHSSLRIVSILTFLPAFPLCVAHGVLSHHSVPAVGLVPLVFSASGAIFLLRRRAVRHDDEEGSSFAAKASHPVLVFVCDIILATALMVVLVFTWIAPGGSPSLSMLAAYATIPLLVNLYISPAKLLELIVANAPSQYHPPPPRPRGILLRPRHPQPRPVARLAHPPPDCPHCHERLRPSFPELPWLERIRERRQRRRDDYTALFIDDEHRYRDEEQGEAPVQEPEHDIVREEEEEHSPPSPVAVEVRRKKDRKNKTTTTTPPSTEDAPSPWGP